MKPSTMLTADTIFRAGILATLAGFVWVMWSQRKEDDPFIGAARPRPRTARSRINANEISNMHDAIWKLDQAKKELAPVLNNDAIRAQLEDWRIQNKKHRSVVDEPIPHKYDHIANLKAWQLRSLQNRIRPRTSKPPKT